MARNLHANLALAGIFDADDALLKEAAALYTSAKIVSAAEHLIDNSSIDALAIRHPREHPPPHPTCAIYWMYWSEE